MTSAEIIMETIVGATMEIQEQDTLLTPKSGTMTQSPRLLCTNTIHFLKQPLQLFKIETVGTSPEDSMLPQKMVKSLDTLKTKCGGVTWEMIAWTLL